MTRRRIQLAILALCLVQAFAAQCLNDINSCLSAIRNAPSGRNATADCLSFLELQASPTGTPSRRTTTTTVTSTQRVATLTLHRSATVARKTGQTSSTASETDDNGNHKRSEGEDDALNEAAPGHLPVPPEALQERRVTTSPTSMTLPLYAKECALEAGYSLACSCLGFPRITRAAAQPVTTKTVTVIRTVGNVTLPPFFANTTRLAGNGTGTVGSTIHTGKNSGRTNSTRPTTLFTSRVSSSKGVGSGSGLSSVSRTTTLSSSKAIFKGTSNGSGSISVSSLSSSSTTKSTVHVVNIATLTTTKEPLWVNTTSTRSHLAGNTTLAPYTDSTAVLATAFENITTSSRLNATTSVNYSILLNTTASWYKGTSTSSILAGTGTGVISTTASVKLPIPQNTTASWYNGTSTSIQPLGTGTGIILTTGMGRPITTTSARIPYPQNPTAPWSNGTSTTFPPLVTGTAIILTTGTGVILTTAPFTYLTTTTTTTTVTTSARFPFPLNTTAFWSNGTATTSSTILGTGTGIGTGIIITGTGYYKSTPTTTTSAKPTATATEDLTCGETTTPFALRVTQPGGTFDKWFVHVVGNGLLFTSSQSQASAFSVEGTGHLCAVGYGDSNGKPRIAAVGVAGAGAGTEEDETDTESGEAGEGPVWMLRQGTLKAYWEDYKALECMRDGGGLSCAPAANGTSAGAGAGADGGGGWVGCGLMLSLGRDVDVGYGGLNCSSIALEVVESWFKVGM